MSRAAAYWVGMALVAIVLVSLTCRLRVARADAPQHNGPEYRVEQLAIYYMGAYGGCLANLYDMHRNAYGVLSEENERQYQDECNNRARHMLANNAHGQRPPGWSGFASILPATPTPTPTPTPQPSYYPYSRWGDFDIWQGS